MEDPSNTLRQEGFTIYRTDRVKRISPTQFLVRTETDIGSFLVELRDGDWHCDCSSELDYCKHRYAVRLSANAARFDQDETAESKLKCRYCGSLDVSRCGFRYNARGIARRYICNECRRKFSVAYVEPQAAPGAPSGTLWLLNQVAMLTSKLNDLLRDLDERIASANHQRTDKALYETTSCTDTEEGATIL